MDKLYNVLNYPPLFQVFLLGNLLGATEVLKRTNGKEEYNSFFYSFLMANCENDPEIFIHWLSQMPKIGNFDTIIFEWIKDHNILCPSCQFGAFTLEGPKITNDLTNKDRHISLN